MTSSARTTSREIDTGMVVLATAAAWIGAGIVFLVPRLIQPVLDSAHKYPSETAIAITDTAHGAIPWLFAIAVTAILCYARARTSPHTVMACAVLSTATMIAVCVAILACVMHFFTLCVDF